MGEIIQFKKREVVSPKVKPRTNGFSRIIRGRTTGYKFYQVETMKEPITPDFGREFQRVEAAMFWCGARIVLEPDTTKLEVQVEKLMKKPNDPTP